MPKMIFDKDAFLNNGQELFAAANKPVDVAPESVDRWLKRGGKLYIEPEAPTEVVEAELDASLAVELEKDGKASHEEVEEAVEKVDSVKEEKGRKNKRR